MGKSKQQATWRGRLWRRLRSSSRNSDAPSPHRAVDVTAFTTPTSSKTTSHRNTMDTQLDKSTSMAIGLGIPPENPQNTARKQPDKNNSRDVSFPFRISPATAPMMDEASNGLAATPTLDDEDQLVEEDPRAIDKEGKRVSPTATIPDNDPRFEACPVGIGSSRTYETLATPILTKQPGEKSVSLATWVRTEGYGEEGALLDTLGVEAIQNVSRDVGRSMNTPGIEALRSAGKGIFNICQGIIKSKKARKEDFKGKKPVRDRMSSTP